MKNPVYESMTKIFVNHWTGPLAVRVWRTEETPFSSGSNTDLRGAVAGLQYLANINQEYSHDTARAIAQTLSNMPRVCAIEILDEHGNGILYYPDWN